MPTAVAIPCAALKLKKILVATDFSEISGRALDYAASFARRYDSHLELAHVIRTNATAQPVLPSSQEEDKKLLRSKIQKLASYTSRGGVRVATSLVEGPVGRSVHDLMLLHEIDMVAVGTHGKRSPEAGLLGSVAEEIFREVPCPVLTIGPAVLRRPELEIRFRHILYATDFTPESAQAAPLALSLAEEYRARLTLVHVVPEEMVSMPEIERHAEYYCEELRKLTSPEAQQWCRPNFLTEYGSPGTVIIDFARDNDVDLIVLGAKKGSVVAHRSFSGTAYNVVCNAECPVLTVRGR